MRICPTCGQSLRHEIVSSVEIDGCDGCGGVWLDRGEIVKLRKNSPELQDAEGAFVPSGSPRRGRQLCPVCGKGLKPYGYAGSDIELETCDDHCGIWFDEGDLARIGSRQRTLSPEALSALAHLEAQAETAKARAETATRIGRMLVSRRTFGRWFF